MLQTDETMPRPSAKGVPHAVLELSVPSCDISDVGGARRATVTPPQLCNPAAVHIWRTITVWLSLFMFSQFRREHLPHPSDAPSSFVDSRVAPTVRTCSVVSPVHVAPGRPHVPADTTAPGGTMITQSANFETPSSRINGVQVYHPAAEKPGNAPLSCATGASGGGGKAGGAGGLVEFSTRITRRPAHAP